VDLTACEKTGILVEEVIMLKIKSLTVSYNGNEILKKISMTIAPGEIFALVGPNGAGKSTLIKTISGVLTPKSGSIYIDRLDIATLNSTQRARHLAVVPQARELPGAYTVYDTVLLGRTPYLGWLGQAGEKDHALVRLAMNRTQTSSLAERRISQLSGGEQQRVLLARALAQNTPIMLLDEPTTHLDLEHQTNLLNLVCQLASEQDLTVLMVLHDLNLAALYASRVAVLVSGRIQAQGTPLEVLTPQTLTSVYNVPVNVISHPEYGTPLVLPEGHQ
jgi:iron complex transport system ATP-binding protein